MLTSNSDFTAVSPLRGRRAPFRDTRFPRLLVRRHGRHEPSQDRHGGPTPHLVRSVRECVSPACSPAVTALTTHQTRRKMRNTERATTGP